MLCYVVQQPETTDRAKDLHSTLVAEWESFEKLIEASNDEQSGAVTEQDNVSTSISDHLKKAATATGGFTTNQPFASKSDVRQKRLFQEAQSDSDGNSSSDSEDESHPVLPTVGVNSGNGNKISRHSTSSDSSPDNKPRTKSAASDNDSSSDDEKCTEQTKLPLCKYQYDMSIVCKDGAAM